MPVYMLDTDIASYIMNGSNEAVTRHLLRTSPADVCISAITKSELLYGIEISPRRKQNEQALDDLLRFIKVLDFSEEAAAHYANIRADLKRRGSMIGSNDLFIAAHARALGLTLVTNNSREFRRVRGLKLENWATKLY
jgi:tRNA(fMet)-specific endonuclease VapC